MVLNKLIQITLCLLTKTSASSFTIHLVYVDDIIIVGTHIKSILHYSYRIKDFGQLKYIIGLEALSVTGTFLGERKYCMYLLSYSILIASKHVSTPSDPFAKLHHDTSTTYTNISCYRRLVSRLLYLNTT